MKDECVTRISSPFQVKLVDMEMCVSNFPQFLYNGRK